LTDNTNLIYLLLATIFVLKRPSSG